MIIGYHIFINPENDFKITLLIKNNWFLLARVTIIPLLKILQADNKIHALESKEINKINSNKRKEKEFSVIIIINQTIGLTAA
jgi:hypothetical protein